MNTPNTGAWKAYSYASFALALGMLAMGVFYAPIDIWVKGYFAMGIVFAVGSSFTLAKTMRDEQEANRLINRIEEANTERLLKEGVVKA